MTGVRDYSTGELKHNVVALAKAAKALKLPIIVTTTARDSMWGPTFPELVEALQASRSSIARRSTPSTTSAWLAPSWVGRKKLIFAVYPRSCAAFRHIPRRSASCGGPHDGASHALVVEGVDRRAIDDLDAWQRLHEFGERWSPHTVARRRG